MIIPELNSPIPWSVQVNQRVECDPDDRASPSNATPTLRQLIKEAPNTRIPPMMSWSGLDSLWRAVRAETFAMWVETDTQVVLVGQSSERILTVNATRSGTFDLLARPGEGAEVLIESGRIGERVTFFVSALRDDQPLLAPGRYTLEIRGRDRTIADSMTTPLTVEVQAPPFFLESVPSALDSSLLLPERTKPAPVRGVLIGLGVGAVTALTANVFRGPEPVASVSSDTRAYAVGGFIALGGILGALFDRGAPLPQNVLQNDHTRNAFEESVMAAQEENRRRREEYTMVIIFSGEQR